MKPAGGLRRERLGGVRHNMLVHMVVARQAASKAPTGRSALVGAGAGAGAGEAVCLATAAFASYPKRAVT
jgi:hypothetical protein